LERFVWDFHTLSVSDVPFHPMWGNSGFYLVFQEWLSPVVDVIEPYSKTQFGPPASTTSWNGFQDCTSADFAGCARNSRSSSK